MIWVKLFVAVTASIFSTARRLGKVSISKKLNEGIISGVNPMQLRHIVPLEVCSFDIMKDYVEIIP